jgi:antimicrobial peptide system SdpB family protein
MSQDDRVRPQENIDALCTNVYGWGRTLLALGNIITLSLTDAITLFRPLHKTIFDGSSVPTFKVNLFSLLSGHLEIARWLAVGVLLVVASGWRPRVTGVLHAWVASSFAAACIVLDGGDQVAAVLSLLLVPVTLCDGRRWHWDPSPTSTASPTREHLRTVILKSTCLMIRLQVAFIYFHAAVEKFKVTEWSDGTALYYWLTNPTVGLPDWLGWLRGAFSYEIVVVVATWGTILLETALFMALVAGRTYKRILLPIAVMFHVAIIFSFGLVSFFFSMAGALVLFLRPWNEPWPEVDLGLLRRLGRFKVSWRQARATVGTGS